MSKILDFGNRKDDKERLKEMARRYFNKNPRLVKSFIRDLAFHLKNIRPRYNSLCDIEEDKIKPNEKQERDNLSEIIDNPALLAKVILIREVFPEEFKKLQDDPKLFSQIEENPSMEIKDFSKGAIDFINTQWPLFKERNANPAYFLRLSGSSGTEYEELFDPSQFINFANNGDIDNFYKSIDAAPKYKRVEYLTNVINAIDSASDPNVKNNIIRSILNSTHLVQDREDRDSLINSLDPHLDQNSGNVFNQQSSKEIHRWLKAIEDTESEGEQMNKILTSQPYSNPDPGVKDRFWEAFVIEDDLPLQDKTIEIFCKFLSKLLLNPNFSEKMKIIDYLEKLKDRIRDLAEPDEITTNVVDYYSSLTSLDAQKEKTFELIKKMTQSISDDKKKDIVVHLINWIEDSEENRKSYAKKNILIKELWPEQRDILKKITPLFEKYYDSLDEEGKKYFDTLIDFLKTKKAWGIAKVRKLKKDSKKTKQSVQK